MKKGETICYYRARGGEKNIYVTVLYDKDKLIESIVEKKEQQKMIIETIKAN